MRPACRRARDGPALPMANQPNAAFTARFWTPEYLEDKLRKLRRAQCDNLVLVVYRGLASGADALSEMSGAPIVWFEKKPRIGPVMEAVARVATLVR